MVGDVTGHGVQSAVAMGRVQSLMRHLAASGEPPITILDRVANTARVMLGTLLATCVTCHAVPHGAGGGRSRSPMPGTSHRC